MPQPKRLRQRAKGSRDPVECVLAWYREPQVGLFRLRIPPNQRGDEPAQLVEERSPGRNQFHEPRQPRPAQKNLIRAVLQHTREQGSLEGEEIKHPVLDGARRHEVHDADGAVLAEPVDPAGPLLQDRGIPGLVHLSDYVTGQAICVGGGMLLSPS